MTRDVIEKRCKLIRYPAVACSASIRRLRMLSRLSKPRHADVIDCHRDGVGLCGTQRFVVGESVELTIRSACEQVSSIRGIVQYVISREKDYRFGVEFINRVKGAPIDQSVLVELERLMKKHLS